MQQGQREIFPSWLPNVFSPCPNQGKYSADEKLGRTSLQFLACRPQREGSSAEGGYPPLHGPSIWLQAAITTDASHWEQVRSCGTFRPNQPVQNSRNFTKYSSSNLVAVNLCFCCTQVDKITRCHPESLGCLCNKGAPRPSNAIPGNSPLRSGPKGQPITCFFSVVLIVLLLSVLIVQTMCTCRTVLWTIRGPVNCLLLGIRPSLQVLRTKMGPSLRALCLSVSKNACLFCTTSFVDAYVDSQQLPPA